MKSVNARRVAAAVTLCVLGVVLLFGISFALQSFWAFVAALLGAIFIVAAFVLVFRALDNAKQAEAEVKARRAKLRDEEFSWSDLNPLVREHVSRMARVVALRLKDPVIVGRYKVTLLGDFESNDMPFARVKVELVGYPPKCVFEGSVMDGTGIPNTDLVLCFWFVGDGKGFAVLVAHAQ